MWARSCSDVGALFLWVLTIDKRRERKEGDSASGAPVEVIERVVQSDVVKMRRVGTE